MKKKVLVLLSILFVLTCQNVFANPVEPYPPKEFPGGSSNYSFYDNVIVEASNQYFAVTIRLKIYKVVRFSMLDHYSYSITGYTIQNLMSEPISRSHGFTFSGDNLIIMVEGESEDPMGDGNYYSLHSVKDLTGYLTTYDHYPYDF